MADDACWNAFGSDSDESEDDLPSTQDEMDAVADAVSLAAIQHFAQLIKTSGVSVKERVVAVQDASEFGALLRDKLSDRGISVTFVSNCETELLFDAAVILDESISADSSNSSVASITRKSLLPGGILWIISTQECNPTEHLSNNVWNIGLAVISHPSSSYKVTRLQKRTCLINSWSCPWMDKVSPIPEYITHDQIGLDIQSNETYLQYEQRLMSDLTICTSAAERTKEKVGSVNVTVLTSAHVDKAVSILQEHGFVIIKGLLPPEQTLPWGDAVLADFQDAVERLKNNRERPVNLLNPHRADEKGEVTKHVFEPLSYKEMSMREDLRVDLRAGPALKKVSEDLPTNATEYQNNQSFAMPKEHNTPFTIDSSMTGTLSHWRFHPSLIAILKALFNPKDDKLSRGNFGRWNFDGSGPDGTPQPFRIGPIGSVISCPGSGDQAIHADTPHLFEHVDCLPCHYCNIFTPGFAVSGAGRDQSFYRHELDDDGAWTGNTTMGGTALVNESHKLSVTARLMVEDTDMDSAESLKRKQLLQLQTIRPALDAGDVLIFDNRTLHYGLANTSSGDESGTDVNAGRRPMLYLNVTQSWFHDPKNWDDRESIFG
jgi:hypothetical protein